MLKYKFLIILPLLSVSSAFADTISIRADIWCPYNCEPSSDKPGYVIEVLKETLGKKGHVIDYQELNWARAIQETKAGKYNAIVGASKSDAPGFIFPDTPQGKGQTCFHVPKNSAWKFDGTKSLENIIIGVIREYSYDGDAIDKYIKENEKNPKRIDIVSGDNPLERNIKKLKLNRIQAILEDTAVYTYVSNNFPEKVEVKIAGCVKDDPIYAAFAPNNPKSKEYVKIINDGLIEMRKNGKLKDILNKYHLADDFTK